MYQAKSHRIFFIILILIGLVCDFSFGQIPIKALEIPVKYITPKEGVSLSLDENKRTGSCWTVFSDRHGNFTYESATGKTIKRTIGFMNCFFVAEENTERVHLIKDKNYKNGFSSGAEDYGWIEKDNLLLWDHCLITKDNRINKKGFFANSIVFTEENNVRIDIQRLNTYYNPGLTLYASSKIHLKDILYIYKITENAILLGKNHITDNYLAKDEIFGWVSSNSIVIWDNRIAVEPNWKKNAVDERRQHSIVTTFFIDAPKAKMFAKQKPISNKYIIWSNDSYEKRNIGDWRRFPLLSYNKESQIIKAGIIGDVLNIGVDMYLPAYAPMKVNGLKYPLFNFVILVTLRELGDLLTKYDALADAYISSSQRQKLKEVWLELLLNQLGDEFSRERAENMPFEKINEKVFGLPGISGLSNIRLADITNPSVVSDSKFYEYFQSIKFKRIEIDKIYNNKDYEYGFYSYDTQYFWISQDLLP